jgi:serine/threonine-protein kinase
MLQHGHIIGGRWELVEDRALFGSNGFGKGGLGVVWKARNRVPLTPEQEIVVLKFAQEEKFNPAALIAEARQQAALRHHPHVVEVFYIHQMDDLLFIEMELMPGGSLDARVRRGALSENDAVTIASHVLDALATAHERDIIHRDVKPLNILFDAHGVAKLADFGLARALEDRSRTFSFAGTRRYMAPETLESEDFSASRKSDVWAVGVTLYEMLTGQLPFGSVAATLRDDPPPLPSRLSAHVIAAVQAALSKEEDPRPAAAELRDRLRHPPAARRVAPAESTLPPIHLQPHLVTLSDEPHERTNPTDNAVMVFVPAGEFIMGTTDDEIESLLKQHPEWKREWFDREKPQHRVHLSGYYIYKHPVTVAQYRQFCRETGRQEPRPPSWGWKDDHPIVNVSWHDAVAYCEWADVRLPTEAEWEKAARGTDGRKYPWGDEWDASRCNNYETGPKQTTPVDSYPLGVSPFGAQDMAGNVWEWCSSLYKPYRYDAKDGREDLRAGGSRVLRGGSWFIVGYGCRAAFRLDLAPAGRYFKFGFRCVQSR